MVYQVGRPCIFEGNRFFHATGIPILKRGRSKGRFEGWLPDPFMVAIVKEKSLMTFLATAGACLVSGSAIVIATPKIIGTGYSDGRVFISSKWDTKAR